LVYDIKGESRLREFENRVLRGIVGPKRDQEKLHNEDRHNLYPSPSALRMTKSRRMI
jgi:hypothetical protein